MSIKGEALRLRTTNEEYRKGYDMIFNTNFDEEEPDTCPNCGKEVNTKVKDYCIYCRFKWEDNK